MVTLKQLAEQLNVSISTVSKALSDSDEISKDTINRVKKLAKELNYQPNRVALSLKNNQTKTIGVIIPSILNRFFANALYGIEKEATKLGYSIITCISNEQLEKERESISVLSNGSVDGFILAVSEETLITKTTNHLQEIINKEIPLINCSKVIIDDFKAAFEATILLLKKERKQIAFISTINDLNVGVLRRNGYDNAILKNSSLGLKPMYLFISKDADYQAVIKKFLQENPKIDAIVAADNITGTIAVNIAKSLNYNIPKDLSIIGFADELVSNLSVPRLTYINQNAQLIGENALRIMVKNLKSKGANKELSTLKIPVEIVHKETT
jgi:LacI family transcriptional regulator